MDKDTKPEDNNDKYVTPNDDLEGVPPPPPPISISNDENKESKAEATINPTDDNSCPPEKSYFEKEENKIESEVNPIIKEKKSRYKNYGETLYFVKCFLVQVIEFILIIIFLVIAFTTEFNKYVLSSVSTMIVLYCLNTFVITILCIFIYCLKGDPPRCDGIYIMNFIYIINVCIYCILFSDFVQEIYIIIVLILILLDLIALLSYALIFKDYNYYGFFGSLAIVNIIAIIIIHFTIGEFGVTWRMMTVALAGIIYFPLITLILSCSDTQDEDFRFCILVYNFGMFFPIAGIVILFFLCITGCGMG